MRELRPLVVADGSALTRAAADLVSRRISDAPDASIVVATGRTPMGLYAELAARRAVGLATQRIEAIQLDEYLGLEPDDRRSLFGWMLRSFVEPLGISPARTVRLPVDGDLEAACAEFDHDLAAGRGIDLAILGLGPNGHLGFNEPPSDENAPTRVVELSRSTIEANARYWGEIADVPRLAVTIGLRQLLSARSILLLASGTDKREIVHEALEGPARAEVPASFLRIAAGEVDVMVDRAAWG